MGRMLRGDWTCRIVTESPLWLSLTRFTAPGTQGTWGLQRETWGLDSGQGDSEGEAIMTEGAEGCKPSRLPIAPQRHCEPKNEEARPPHYCCADHIPD
jgi:hypothetical protein